MNLRKQIKKILREESDSSTRRRFTNVNNVIHSVLISSYPCDYNNFEHYFLGIVDEINLYYRFMYSGSDIGLKEPEVIEDIVKRYFTNMIKEYYLENTQDC
jgi:hypothetical protein